MKILPNKDQDINSEILEAKDLVTELIKL